MKDPAVIIATASVIVAIAALVIATWQAFVTRDAARLALRPIVEITAFSSGTPGIFLANVGHGPAFIQSIHFESKLLTLELCGTAHYERLTDLFRPPGIAVRFNAKIPEKNSVIAAGQELPLFALDATDDLAAVNAHLKALFADCRISVKYSCLYDQRYETEYKRVRSAA